MRRVALGALAALLAGCSDEAQRPAAEAAAPAAPAATPRPEPVNGWVELPEAEGLHITRSAAWRTDEIDIPVPANGGDLEYKLAMRKGDVVVYSISYPGLAHPGLFVTEFHGHTEKGPDGVGDLMFYSKTGGSEEHGALEAPFEGIHGWYLKNDTDADLTVKLKLAGFYEIVGLPAPNPASAGNAPSPAP